MFTTVETFFQKIKYIYTRQCISYTVKQISASFHICNSLLTPLNVKQTIHHATSRNENEFSSNYLF